MEEKAYWIGFSVFPGVGPITFSHLLRVFGSAKSAWKADEKELLRILKEKKTKDFLAFRNKFDIAEYLQNLEKAQVFTLAAFENIYPQQLKQVEKAPFILYGKGDQKVLENIGHNTSIAIVGTRKVTDYGKMVTQLFTAELVARGSIIISGLALGVDAVAHQTTLNHEGKTIAVLGCGVDCCYPRENQQIYDSILAKNGLILSEIPLGQSAGIGTFPARNRIVAALSDGILVTEGAADSGALITAEFGLEYGKKVFAVPGPITSSLSQGPYALIAKGAKLVTTPEDIILELKIIHSINSGQANHESRIHKEKIVGDTKEEQLVIDLLENEPMSFDELVRKLHIDPASMASVLSLLEIKGIITVGNADKYSLSLR